MNREIKFRAWGRWGDWSETEDKRGWIMIDGDSLCFEEFEPITRLLTDIEDEAYFMQFVGLKDKNGKEIYEGDILKLTSLTNRVLKHFWFVDYDSKSCIYVLRHLEDSMPINALIKEHEIVGNIYENPEFLRPARELK